VVSGIDRHRPAVLTANSGAIRFYERHGLRPVSVRVLSEG